MNKSLFLTGCCGFIGLNFLKQIYDSGFYKNYQHIYNLDKMGYATKYNMDEYYRLCALFDKEQQGKFITISLSSEEFSTFPIETVYNLVYNDLDVVDFASESHVDKSIKNPHQIFMENCRIPGDIYSVFGRRISTYYHISTDEVYGDIPYVWRNDQRSYFSPLSSFRPSNPYSASKISQDLYLASLERTFGLKVVIIRMANQFGMFQHPEKMIPASIIRALRGETIKIYGEGKNCRQWTLVDDTVKFIQDIVDNKVENHSLVQPEVVHAANMNNLIDNNVLVEKIVNSLKRYNINAQVEYIKDRLGHDQVYALRVADEHKSYFTTSIDQSIDSIVDYYYARFNNGDFK